MNTECSKIYVPSKKRKLSDKEVCFICKQASSEGYVAHPTDVAYEKLTSCVQNRAFWGDAACNAILEEFSDGFGGESIRSKNLKWHRSCYSDITNKSNIERIQKKFDERGNKGVQTSNATTQNKPTTPPRKVVTRTQVPLYDKTKCFFCDQFEAGQEKLSKVATDRAGKHLFEAVNLSNNETLLIRLAGAHDPKDAHAIDVLYHSKCWVENVTNVLRKQHRVSCSNEKAEAAHSISKVEFITALREALRCGNIFSMDTVEEKYKSICRSYNVEKSDIMSRKVLKKFISIELSDEKIEFSRPKKLNEPQRISLKTTRDILLQMAEGNEGIDVENRILYRAASILRQKMNQQKSWHFKGSFPENLEEIVPNELKAFTKWCIKGDTNIFTEADSTKNQEIEKRSVVLSQMFLTSCLTKRQVQNRKSSSYYSSHETPLNVGLGIFVHSTTRDKGLIDLLHKLNLSIDYERILRLETQIASSVIRNVQENSGIYIPSDIVRGKFIHCAMDNIDFLEDTVDGKRTLHGTVMTIYQVRDESVADVPLTLNSSNERSLIQYSEVLPDVFHFRKPKSWTTCCPGPKSLSTQSFMKTAVQNSRLCNLAWTLLRKSCFSKRDELKDSNEKERNLDSRNQAVSFFPSLTWAGYMSLLSDVKPIFTVSTLPLIPFSPTDPAVQLACMERFGQINAVLDGAEKKVVVTMDMALYKPLKQLEMAEKDHQDKWILKPGELHIIIAMLRTIGAFIQGSGIPELWVDSDLYGTATVRQILEGRHVRRGLEAHSSTFSALSMLLLEEFSSECDNFSNNIEPNVSQIENSLQNWDAAELRKMNVDLLKAIDSKEILTKLTKFCDEKGMNEPVFKFATTYMEMVELMLLFLKAVRSSDWLLSLAALQDFTKYFFAMDRQNYARMIPLYLAEMAQLETSDPLVWKEFLQGNWVVNKNKIPFSALGADEALEHENRRLKVQGGLTGITLKEGARTRLFLADVELTRLISKLETFADVKKYNRTQHHSMSIQTRRRQDKNVLQLKEAFDATTNPFSSHSKNLLHLVSQQIFSAEIQSDVARTKAVGEEMFHSFVRQRIETNTEQFWSPMKKIQLKLFRSATKKVKLDVKGKITEVKADNSLLTRLIVASRSRADVDIKTCISQYELSAVPRSLFTANGSMHHCLAKYKLAEILESLPTQSDDPDGDLLEIDPAMAATGKVAIVDGMAMLHTISKPTSIKTCHELGLYFCKIVSDKFEKYDEVHMVFDSYKENSLKMAIRNHRQSNCGRSQYKIIPSTNIGNTSMRKLLSHETTKDELTDFLATYLLKYGTEHKRNFVVSWRDTAKATNKDVSKLISNHEEADTKIMLHGAFVASEGKATMHIFSPDTDVLILALRRYPMLPIDSGMFLGLGMKRFVSLKPIYDVLGPLKAAALPGLHALSGCDTTGQFANKGKPSWWKAFLKTDSEVLKALAELGSSPILTAETIKMTEKFACQVYLGPKTKITDIGEARWWLFTKKHYYDERLPPTKEAFVQALRRANLQSIVWSQDLATKQNVPPPLEHGWKKSGDGFEPIFCDKPSAPNFLIDIIKCNCKQKRCSQNCSCRNHGLECTEMCLCNGDRSNCDNVKEDDENSEDEYCDSTTDDDVDEDGY